MDRPVKDHPFLNTIVQSKLAEVEKAEREQPLFRLQETVRNASRKPLSLRDAWQRGSGVRTIAETKGKSPSRGVIRDPYEPESIVSGYLANGASGISVLTDGPFFGGSPNDLRRLKDKLDPENRVPFLRKDFLLTPYQIWESRAMGADIVLLIVRILSPRKLAELIGLARCLGLSSLIEVHSREELDQALDAGADLVGVNHRDLDTMRMNMDLSEKLVPHIPPDVLRVAESGLKGARDRIRMEQLGYDAVLVGESFLAAPDPGAALREFLLDVD